MATLSTCFVAYFFAYVVLVSSGQGKFSGIKFCNEKYFDNMFQIREHIYLNVFDASEKENRLYRWLPGSSQIDQFVTMNVDGGWYLTIVVAGQFDNLPPPPHMTDFHIPQSGFFISDYLGGITVRTYYQPIESGEIGATICAYYGPEMRVRYSLADPFPLYPVAGCCKTTKHNYNNCTEDYPLEQQLQYLKEYNNGSRRFPKNVPDSDSLNNKYRSYYFHEAPICESCFLRQSTLYMFKRNSRREVVTMTNSTNMRFTEALNRAGLYPINYEVVGLVGSGNASRYLLEEVVISEINYITQYMWQAKLNGSNGTIQLSNRVHWRQFFGCHTSTGLVAIPMLLLILGTLFVLVAMCKLSSNQCHPYLNHYFSSVVYEILLL